MRTLDRDLGVSGAQTAGREDFKTLVADVSMGQVGAVFALEVSRLARSNLDWHRLLELCALTDTLVIDADGYYDPASAAGNAATRGARWACNAPNGSSNSSDQEEALEVADRVGVMKSGRIGQFASPQEVYERPQTGFVYRFLGHYNTLSHREFAAASGNPVQVAAYAATPDGPDVFVRPHELGIEREGGGPHGLAATVAHIGFAGAAVKVELRIGSSPGSVDVELQELEYRRLALEVSQPVLLYLRDRQPAGASVGRQLAVMG